MDFTACLEPGIEGQKEETVTDNNTAGAWGSGGLAVYATPAMIALLEGACVAAVDPRLPEGFSTVGTVLQVKHLAATPVGMTVKAQGRLVEIDGRRLVFTVEAYDAAGKIGEGVHERFIVENEKFLKKAEAKKASN
ncbi:MAG: thioesterase family protein [Treponema sp.]|jgi:predicted thioesterase|nr:thioesterase family protein [Treponema sp.]